MKREVLSPNPPLSFKLLVALPLVAAMIALMCLPVVVVIRDLLRSSPVAALTDAGGGSHDAPPRCLELIDVVGADN